MFRACRIRAKSQGGPQGTTTYCGQNREIAGTSCQAPGKLEVSRAVPLARPLTPRAPPRYHDPMLRRLRPILFPTAAAASAFVLLAVLILWPRSYLRRDEISYGSRATLQVSEIISCPGRLAWYKGWDEFVRQALTYRSSPARIWWTTCPWHSWSYADHSEFTVESNCCRFMGCVYDEEFPSIPMLFNCTVAIPYSYLAVLCAVMPTIWLLTRKRRRHRHRLAHGLCLKCGYDLRAHKPGDRCPECGTVTAKEA